MQTVRNLAECSANWQGYDESFWAVRAMQGWFWDSVNYELWRKAAQQPQPWIVTQGEPPFTGVSATEQLAFVRRTTGAGVPTTPVASVISASCAGGGS